MNINIKNHQLGTIGQIFIAKSVYSREAIIKSAYEITERSYVFISEDDANYIINISQKEKNEHLLERLEKACAEFVSLIIEYEIRSVVYKETSTIRETIITAAFSEAAKGLTHSHNLMTEREVELSSYKEDKNNIIKLRG